MALGEERPVNDEHVNARRRYVVSAGALRLARSLNDAGSVSATTGRSARTTLTVTVAGRDRHVGVGVAPLRVRQRACRGHP